MIYLLGLSLDPTHLQKSILCLQPFVVHHLMHSSYQFLGESILFSFYRESKPQRLKGMPMVTKVLVMVVLHIPSLSYALNWQRNGDSQEGGCCSSLDHSSSKSLAVPYYQSFGWQWPVYPPKPPAKREECISRNLSFELQWRLRAWDPKHMSRPEQYPEKMGLRSWSTKGTAPKTSQMSLKIKSVIFWKPFSFGP